MSGVRRDRAFKVTTARVTLATRPADLVDRKFTATRPNELLVANITYVAAWTGFACVSSVTGVCSRMIVGWRVSITRYLGDRSSDRSG